MHGIDDDRVRRHDNAIYNTGIPLRHTGIPLLDRRHTTLPLLEISGTNKTSGTISRT